MKKRFCILFILCLLCLSFACAKKAEPKPEPAPAVTAPAEAEVTLRLPLGARSDVAEALPAYAAGFRAANGEALTFAVGGGDARVAEGILREDGTLYVIAHGTGETKLTVTAKTASGEQASASVSVTVRDARRTLALIVLGALVVALLALFGRPVKKNPETPAEEASAAEAPETPTVIFEEEKPETPTAVFEEPNDNPERS